jgi:hypothetical protein
MTFQLSKRPLLDQDDWMSQCESIEAGGSVMSNRATPESDWYARAPDVVVVCWR